MATSLPSNCTSIRDSEVGIVGFVAIVDVCRPREVGISSLYITIRMEVCVNENTLVVNKTY